MGLAGRKVKQKIPNDPRNLSWADDAARFGSNYLSKFGWDSSKGLGAGGEGRTSHIKVAHKLDMLGIGAAHRGDPNGIAWKQNKDFENLLKRLNEANESGGDEKGEEGTAIDGFVKPKERSEEEKEDEEEVEKEKERVKNRKRKRNEDDGEEKKKRKRERKAEKKMKQKEMEVEDSESVKPTKSRSKSPGPTPTGEKEPARAVPRHRSHRARHIAAKSLALKSATAISEILGIAPTLSASSSSTPSGAQTPQEAKLTSVYDANNNTETEGITTSTKSLQDYFKEKMGKFKGVAVKSATTGETAVVDYDDVPRGGLGSRPKQVDNEGDGTPKIGLFKFSQLMSSSFIAAITPSEEETEETQQRKERRQRKIRT